MQTTRFGSRRCRHHNNSGISVHVSNVATVVKIVSFCHKGLQRVVYAPFTHSFSCTQNNGNYYTLYTYTLSLYSVHSTSIHCQNSDMHPVFCCHMRQCFRKPKMHLTLSNSDICSQEVFF